MQLGPGTLSLLLITVVLFPVGSYFSYRKINAGKPLAPKVRRFRITILLQLVLLVVALLAAGENHLSLWRPPREQILWFYGLLIAIAPAFAMTRRWSKIPEERKKRILIFMPESTAHLVYWIPMSLLAGVGEEIAYRGVLFSLLRFETHSLWWALLIAILVFTVGHMAQGLKSLIGVAYLALVFHIFVLLSSSLYIAMLMHATHNLLVGIAVMRLAQRDGLWQATSAPAASP